MANDQRPTTNDQRPALLGLVGQPRVEAILGCALARDRVSHAYLFVGPSNVGKSTAAVLLAQALNCQGSTNDQRPTTNESGSSRSLVVGRWSLVGVLTPCGACESCQRIAAETHPDVHTILPQSKSGQNISVEQMRDVRRDAALRPSMGRRKVYLIPDADRMNLEAANTVLKTLEEPSAFVTLILIAPSVESVLPTIESRCQIVRFGLARPEVIATALQDRFGMPEDEALSLAHAAGGRVGLAFTWAADGSVREQREQLLALLREAEAHRQAALSRPGRQIAALRLAEAFRALAPQAAGTTAGARVALAELLDLARDHYRDQLIAGVSGKESSVPDTRHPTPDTLLRAIDTVSESRRFLERNVAPQLVLERMFTRLIGDPVETGGRR